MNAPSSNRGLPAVGIILILAGLAVFGLRQAGFDPFDRLLAAGWPLFVIVPGLVLLGASVVPAAPNGVGFAIAGSIVTIVGLLLAYQEATGHWESWSYAWALVGPGGAGVGMLGYGLLYRQADLVGVGVRLVGIALAIFVVGFLFFESIFDNGRVPADLGTWWPIGVIGLGVLVLLGAILDPGRRRDGS